MDRLWALRNDYGPWLHGSLFTTIRWTAFRCPYCRWPFKVTWGPSNSLLGSGERTCWRCKQTFWDSSREWPEMTGRERYSFLVPITVAGYLGAFLLLVGIDVYALLILKATFVNYGDLIFLIVLSFPLACWFLFRFAQVIRSIGRYNDRGSS
jgi:hypothetical protein